MKSNENGWLLRDKNKTIKMKRVITSLYIYSMLYECGIVAVYIRMRNNNIYSKIFDHLRSVICFWKNKFLYFKNVPYFPAFFSFPFSFPLSYHFGAIFNIRRILQFSTTSFFWRPNVSFSFLLFYLAHCVLCSRAAATHCYNLSFYHTTHSLCIALKISLFSKVFSFYFSYNSAIPVWIHWNIWQKAIHKRK